MKKLSIHCFQHVSFEDPGCITQWCREKGHEMTFTRFFEKDTIPSTDEYDWLVIMGGPMGVYDENRYQWLVKEKEAIKAAINAGKKVLGICLGSQLIADVLGAKVFPNREKEIGWFNISLTEQAKLHPLWQAMGESFPVFHWHGDTFDLPQQAQLLASSEACRNQAFTVNDQVIGLQFHFEVTAQSLEAMVENGKEELTHGTYIQDAVAISNQRHLIAGNNEKMFRVLDYLAGN
ncbi:type 1 glutamine amidotransferase [Filimonas effusa]|uniref:Type 1 glutamine amidotransferase n=1 Tax=Filimonas effusa TaxID=2508721 RepID=A0A4Q1DDN4_9BACT|nr:type 1 glutamine amidotransferase [Filimonas effusa]RXK87088.1 type 1 glutamine amidotransferase [Filimonas effusa]